MEDLESVTGLFQFGKRVKIDEKFYHNDEMLLNAYKDFINGRPVKMVFCDSKGLYPTRPEYYTYGK